VRAIEHEGLLLHESQTKPCSGDAKTERRGKGIWYSEEPDGDFWSGFRASIASEAFSPGQTVVGSLGAGDQSDWRRLSRWSRFSEFNIDTLMVKELDHLSSLKTALPVSPENGVRGRKWKRGKCDLLGGVAWPEHALTRRGFLVAAP
jgi:hypothetical protein